VLDLPERSAAIVPISRHSNRGASSTISSSSSHADSRGGTRPLCLSARSEHRSLFRRDMDARLHEVPGLVLTSDLPRDVGNMNAPVTFSFGEDVSRLRCTQPYFLIGSRRTSALPDS
jgi:hypothetical protein